jgi:hypothetical protein
MYKITVYDYAGHQSSYYVILDNTPPTLSGNALLSPIEPDYGTIPIVNQFTGTAFDTYFKETVIARKVSGIWLEYGRVTSPQLTLTEDGIYRITVYDTSGNFNSYYCIIDNNPPIIHLKNGEIYHLPEIDFDAGGSGLLSVRLSNSAQTIWNDLVSGTTLDGNFPDGVYTLTVTNTSQKTTTVQFELRNTPVLSVLKNDVYVPIEDDVVMYVNGDVDIVLQVSYCFDPILTNQEDEECQIVDNIVSLEKLEAGIYTYKLVGLAGVMKEFSFEVVVDMPQTEITLSQDFTNH